MRVTIRGLQSEDFAQVRVIDEAIEEDYLGEQWERFSSQEKEAHLSAIQPQFDFFVTTGFSLVALVNEKIVGFLLAYRLPPFAGSVYIQQVSVHLEHQRKGVASALYAALINEARANDMKEIRAHIYPTNNKSIDLHRKFGFAIEERKAAKLRL